MNVCLFADARSVHIQQLVRALVSRGMTVHVVTHKPANLPGAGVERFVVPPPGIMNPRRWQGRWRNQLRGFLRRFDVINIHFLEDWGFGEWIAEERSSRAAVVATAWGSDIIDPPGETPASPKLKRTRVEMLRAADAVTVCGPSFARTVSRFAEIDVQRINVVPFGVDVDLFCPATGRRDDSRGSPLIGFFKGFRAVYGARTLVEAIPEVLAQVPDARFELIGDGIERSPCQLLAQSLGVHSHIDWVPRQPHERLPGRIARWRVSVVPSVHEAFGVAALESSAAGVPVVASDVCGLRDTVRDGVTGFLVPPGESGRFADAIVRLLRDESLRETMGNAGRRMAESEYDWRAVARQWVELYERVSDQRAVMV